LDLVRQTWLPLIRLVCAASLSVLLLI